MTAPAYKHGHGYESPTYRSWKVMRNRCERPADKRWGDYGGRGISVCESWRDFRNFLADMGERPDGTTLDRVDVNGNYEPGNCRWATGREQALNRRDNRVVTLRGLRMTLTEACEEVGLAFNVARARLNRGWGVEECFATPVGRVGAKHRSRT